MVTAPPQSSISRPDDGNRVKPSGRVQAALTGLAGVVDGPFAKQRGSYLVSARKSFLGYVVRRFNDQFQYTNNPPVIDVADFQSKVVHDLSKRNQVGINLIFGNFLYDRNRDRDLLGIEPSLSGKTQELSAQRLLEFHAATKPVLADASIRSRTQLSEIQTSMTGRLLDEQRSQIGVRSDLSYQVRKHTN